METIYTTIENQIRADGTKGLLYDHYTDLNTAYAKYYTILAAAAVSDLPYHAAYLLSTEVAVLEHRAFDRRVAPEPEE